MRTEKHTKKCLCIDCVEAELIIIHSNGLIDRRYNKETGDFEYKINNKGLKWIKERSCDESN